MCWWSHTWARSASGVITHHFRHMATEMVVHWLQVLLFLFQHPYLDTRGHSYMKMLCISRDKWNWKTSYLLGYWKGMAYISSSCTDSCRNLCHTYGSHVSRLGWSPLRHMYVSHVSRLGWSPLRHTYVSHVSRLGWSGCTALTCVCICCLTWHDYVSQCKCEVSSKSYVRTNIRTYVHCGGYLLYELYESSQS